MSMEVVTVTASDLKGALLIQGSRDTDWYIASSLNNNLCAEGSWEMWVLLARKILNEDKKRKIHLVKVSTLNLVVIVKI